MITNERVVPVNLIAGKEYVMRNGRHVYVKDNPHWQCAAKFPFCAMEGGVVLVYLTPNGEADPAGGENEDDIIRPVYEKGQTYLDGYNYRVTIDTVDGLNRKTCVYPVQGSNDSQYTIDGKYLHDASDNLMENLFDYAPDLSCSAATIESDVKSTVCQVFSPTVERTTLPKLPSIAFTKFGVGARVEVQLDRANIVQATVMYEDASYVAIEFDSGYFHSGAWTCDGHVPSGRGWYVKKDSVLGVVSKSETQAEAARSEPEALNAEDFAEVWAAYRINPSISIDAWIAARRVLKTAAKQ